MSTGFALGFEGLESEGLRGFTEAGNLHSDLDLPFALTLFVLGTGTARTLDFSVLKWLGCFIYIFVADPSVLYIDVCVFAAP